MHGVVFRLLEGSPKGTVVARIRAPRLFARCADPSNPCARMYLRCIIYPTFASHIYHPLFSKSKKVV